MNELRIFASRRTKGPNYGAAKALFDEFTVRVHKSLEEADEAYAAELQKNFDLQGKLEEALNARDAALSRNHNLVLLSRTEEQHLARRIAALKGVITRMQKDMQPKKGRRR